MGTFGSGMSGFGSLVAGVSPAGLSANATNRDRDSAKRDHPAKRDLPTPAPPHEHDEVTTSAEALAAAANGAQPLSPDNHSGHPAAPTAPPRLDVQG